MGGSCTSVEDGIEDARRASSDLAMHIGGTVMVFTREIRWPANKSPPYSFEPP